MGPQADQIHMRLLRKLLGLQPAKPVSSGTHSQLTSATSQQSKSAAAFDLPDESACPSMPHPGSWTAIAEPPGRACESQRREENSRTSADARSDLERRHATPSSH